MKHTFQPPLVVPPVVVGLDRILPPPPPEIHVVAALLGEILQEGGVAVCLADTRFVSSGPPPPPGIGLEQQDGLCARTVSRPDGLLLVEDLRSDPDPDLARLADPAGPGPVRFFAGSAVRSADGTVLGVLCAFGPAPRRLGPRLGAVMRRLADILAHLLSLHEALSRFGRAMALTPHMAWIAAPDGTALEICELMIGVRGVPPGRPALPERPVEPEPPEAARARALWAHALQTGTPYECEQRLRFPDGRERWFRVTAMPARDAEGSVTRWYGLSEDIHDRRTSQFWLDYLVNHDVLTGLASPARLRRAVGALGDGAAGRPFALLRIDLDEFRAVNDACGQRVGDLMLQQIAARIVACLNATDLPTRESGDVFLVLLPGSGSRIDAARVARRLLRSIAQPIRIADATLVTAASIGIAVSPADGTTVDMLLQNTRLALARARREGHGGFRFFEPDMDERHRLHQAMKVDLRDALDRGEFALAYQPLIEAATGRVSGFEALLRWHHPDRGTIPPAEFIPVAEHNGLIVPIGDWVLQTACREASTWPAPLRVAVNLSAMQLRQHALPQTVGSALRLSGLARHRLELEMTESAPFEDGAVHGAVLRQLQALGVRIALDDFGTGYSSLGCLQRFNFDTLKIDRSFVSRMTEAGDAYTIVLAVLRMSQALGLSTTAEGVESREQARILAEHGCDRFQGYFFSRPVPADAVPALLVELEARRLREGWGRAP